MDIQGGIRTWLLKQQDWLQEAADRLLKNGLLTQDDIAALASHVKTAGGQAVTHHRPFDELMHDPEDLSEVRLARIDGVTGIESLGPRKPLDFGERQSTTQVDQIRYIRKSRLRTRTDQTERRLRQCLTSQIGTHDIARLSDAGTIRPALQNQTLFLLSERFDRFDGFRLL